MFDRAKSRRWQLVTLDLDLDTASSAGEFTACVLAAAAQYERRSGDRTREGMAQRNAEGCTVAARFRWLSWYPATLAKILKSSTAKRLLAAREDL